MSEPTCRGCKRLQPALESQALFCPYCGQQLSPHTPPIILDAPPLAESIQFTLGPYQILSTLGKGGMGEVFAAYDTTCGRNIALKRIREEFANNPQLQRRFLKEAHITSQLTHPAIIPIYTIHKKETLIYYTMPLVKGKTLKTLIQEQKNNQLANDLPQLMRIFLTVCHAVAYAHAKNVLHRDLKPENIIIGEYGEVLILDWGLAKCISHPEEAEITHKQHDSLYGLTRLGKVVGTLAYMAPERALGKPAGIQTDIYSLGVILYLLLTLQHPFHRKNLSSFRKNWQKELLRDPLEVAPMRDIPPTLARIAKNSLTNDPKRRYQSVEELIQNVENAISGRSQWFEIAQLDIGRKQDWEFQENVLIDEHTALTRGSGTSEWVSLMVSKSSFTGNTRLTAKVRCGPRSHGIGLMLSIPEAAERIHINDGYCLWLGTDLAPTTKLLKSTVEVISRSDITLQREQWYTVSVEKLDDNLHIYLNEVLQFSYISHIPIAGTHVGLLTRDAEFAIQRLSISISSLNLTVSCLAIPDALLAHKSYGAAINEYRRIAYSFPGHMEGREALFKAGVTLLEQARNCNDSEKSAKLFELSLDEFSKQHNTPGAPLEYIGKGLVYWALKDYVEEIKCYEMAYRRHPKHPSLSRLHEQVICRLYETSMHDRKAAFELALLAIRFVPKEILKDNVRKVFLSLKKHWEPLEFIQRDATADQQLDDSLFAISLSFWLAKPYAIAELIHEQLNLAFPSFIALSNAIYSLLELGAQDIAKTKCQEIAEALEGTALLEEQQHLYCQFAKAASWQQEHLSSALEDLKVLLNKKITEERLWLYLMRLALKARSTKIILNISEFLKKHPLSDSQQLRVDHYCIWALLLEKRWREAGMLLHNYPLELLSQESSPFHLLYGCWLLATEGREIANIHFGTPLEVLYPRSWMLLGYAVQKKIGPETPWHQKAFLWEKRQLLAQLSLFSHCGGNEERAAYYHALELEEYVNPSPL